jgi:integrase
MINTGYRLSEGANLQPGDIRLDGAIPHLVIRGNERSLKTRHSARHVPLAGISLRAFQDCPTGFPRYRDKASLSERLNSFLTAQGLRETPRHTTYSLRHAFEQRLIGAGVDRRLQAELMGHSDGRPAYARPLPLDMLLPAIEAITLD